MTKGFGWSVAASHTYATEVSNLTSSTSGSNYGARSAFNPNENVAANSAYLVKNRINALRNFEKAFFGTYKTRFGVFYEGRTGKPYSWTFKNDLNGDGVSGNDLMYIPRAFGSGDVIFAGDTATKTSGCTRKITGDCSARISCTASNARLRAARSVVVCCACRSRSISASHAVAGFASPGFHGCIAPELSQVFIWLFGSISTFELPSRHASYCWVLVILSMSD